MPVPKMKISKARRNKRRAHHALTPVNLCPCPNCAAPRLPHAVCDSCGFYKGRFIPKTALGVDLIAALK